MKRLATFAAGLATTALVGAMFTPSAGAADFETSAESRAPANARSYGLLLNGVLVSFPLNNPQSINRIGRPTLGEGDTELVGMDIRPSNGRMYAIGDGGGVYIIRFKDAGTRQVGQLSEDLEGNNFGVDFNPAADALRIVSDSGQNLRVTFEGINVAATNVDGDLNDGTPTGLPPAPTPVNGVTAAAYTNNDNAASTGTTLLDINTTADTLAVQAPANQGALSTVGSLRTNFGTDASFDIYTRVDGRGQASDNAGYAAVQRNDDRLLWHINLTTGKATRIGIFPNNARVSDIAIAIPNNR